MKETFVRIHTKRQLRERKRQANIPYRDAISIGLLFTVEDKNKHDKIKEFVRRLESDGKKVSVLELLPDKTENYEFRYPFFSAKDFSFWGHLQSRDALTFINQKFDFLYVIDLVPNSWILHILSRSKAVCRAGRYFENGEPYYDLMIESVANVDELIQNLYTYTSKL